MTQHTEREALLPCPFCGGEPTVSAFETESLWSHTAVTHTQVGCEICDFQHSTEPGYELEALDWWNRRALNPDHARQVDVAEDVATVHNERDDRASLRISENQRLLLIDLLNSATHRGLVNELKCVLYDLESM